MLQLSFFRNLTFTGANLVGLVISFGFFGIIFFMSLFWQNVQGYSPTRSGVLSLPLTLGVMIVGHRSPGASWAASAPGCRSRMGLAVTGSGLLLLITVHADSPYSVHVAVAGAHRPRQRPGR